ncbi:hypothetical protein NC653_037148 [Populus alba x Populus x berolinensis]|uniref:Pentatricopeptide repeat-containing protein n=1 Tax=Populus alba x Populus x berolinensis TaxID=444605 RepID=A0AAD6LLY4_9ROSI|nr:hypothetical protein NC653_037148 [Populus alba x Populus x berolinensis]
MSTKRLLSANNFHPFPPMMKNYLQWAQNTPTQKSGTPFNAKGYTHCNEYTQAWSVFVDMVKNGNDPPNAFTISSVLKACKGMKRVFLEECCVLDYLDCWLHSQRQWQSRTSNLPEMLLDGVALNPHSISIAVRACASIGSQNFGRQIHTAVIKHGCGCLSEANKYFNDMTEKDLITWNTLNSWV